MHPGVVPLVRADLVALPGGSGHSSLPLAACSWVAWPVLPHSDCPGDTVRARVRSVRRGLERSMDRELASLRHLESPSTRRRTAYRRSSATIHGPMTTRTTDSMSSIRVRMAPARPGRCTSALPGRACTTTCSRATMGGTYVLRIEDTDLVRSTVEFESDILDNLHWLGITWDEGPQHAGRRGHRSLCALPPEPAMDRYAARGCPPAGIRRGLPLLVHARGAGIGPP